MEGSASGGGQFLSDGEGSFGREEFLGRGPLWLMPVGKWRQGRRSWCWSVVFRLARLLQSAPVSAGNDHGGRSTAFPDLIDLGPFIAALRAIWS